MLASTTITGSLQAVHDAALTALHGAQRMALVEEAAEKVQASVLGEAWLKELEAAARVQWVRLTEGG
jgi:hypothetical protein